MHGWPPLSPVFWETPREETCVLQGELSGPSQEDMDLSP